MGTARTILHVDMDAFYASIEQRDNPELRGKPVLVGGRGKRGVITAASYESRVYGCRSAMPTGMALRLCPHAIVVRGRIDVYIAESRRIRVIFEEFTPDIQPVSIDEAFLDVTGVARLKGDGATIGAAIKKRIREETGLTASVGVAPNKFLAKFASDLDKPDGLRVIRAEEAAALLAPMPVSVIYGIGKVGAKKLEELGIRTVAQLRDMNDEALASLFGESGAYWKRLAVGDDSRPVHERARQKSIGKEHTFGDDIADPQRLRAILLDEIEHAARSLRDDGLLCRCVSLKLRRPDFTTYTRAATLPEATDSTQALWEAACPLLDAFLKDQPTPLRLLGVSLKELEAPAQIGLFAEKERKRGRVDEAADAIVAKFGRGAIRRGGSMGGR